MIFAGAVEFDPEFVILVLVLLGLVALAFAALGGAIAAMIAGQRRAFWVGSLVCAVATVLVAGGGAPEAAPFVGVGASAVVGLVYGKG